MCSGVEDEKASGVHTISKIKWNCLDTNLGYTKLIYEKPVFNCVCFSVLSSLVVHVFSYRASTEP